jgi:hypothetical protein
LAGKIIPANQDVLDTIGEPPRVSIRRRMIRTIADVALAKYDRWYVMGHSLGSVVAFNGLMESAYAWPGYVDEERWEQLVDNGFAGPAQADFQVPADSATTRPRRPIWLPRNHVAYRKAVFDRFHGLLTFGSPLEKFAAIWPANVPRSKQPAFRPEAHWINAYDPIDPVSGVLKAFGTEPPVVVSGAIACPTPQNCGYKSGNVFLLNHLTYLEQKQERSGSACNTLADFVADWLTRGNPATIDPAGNPRFFWPDDATHRKRSVGLWLWWILAAAGLLLLGGIIAPLVITGAVQALDAILNSIAGAFQ